MKTAIVVPTIREDCIKRFLSEWRDEFANYPIFVIEDNPKKTFKLEGDNIRHFSWKEIDKELGKKSWIIPRRTDCIRSFGFYKAYQEGVDVIITLDDDCYPLDSEFVKEHLEPLQRYSSRWRWTTKEIKPRGVPYRNIGVMPIMLNMGFWRGVADLDAITELVYGERDLEPYEGIVALKHYFPMCGMNVSFRRELTPMMYWLLMGEKYEYDRFGDIWCGLFMKKVCDYLEFGVKIGGPAVKHERASNVWRNLEKEHKGVIANEILWQAVDSVKLTKKTVKDCYIELARKLPFKGDYGKKLKEAMQIWANLF